MGRLKKYNTPEELKAAKQAAVRRYYWKNKEAQDQRARVNYQKKKNERA